MFHISDAKQRKDKTRWYEGLFSYLFLRPKLTNWDAKMLRVTSFSQAACNLVQFLKASREWSKLSFKLQNKIYSFLFMNDPTVVVGMINMFRPSNLVSGICSCDRLVDNTSIVIIVGTITWSYVVVAATLVHVLLNILRLLSWSYQRVSFSGTVITKLVALLYWKCNCNCWKRSWIVLFVREE